MTLVAMVMVVCALAVPETLTDDGENVHSAPAGSPEHAKATVPENPLLGARLTVADALPPEVTVKAAVDALRANVPEPGLAATDAIEPNNPSFSWFKPAEK